MEYQEIDLKFIREEIFKESQKDFADHLGLKARTYQNYELNGVPIKKRPDIKVLLRDYAKRTGKRLEYDSVPHKDLVKENNIEFSGLTVRKISEIVAEHREVFIKDTLFNTFLEMETMKKMLQIQELKKDKDR